MLPQVDALPSAKTESTFNDWNGERGRSEGRLDMRRHVVSSFRGVRKDRIVLGDEPTQPGLEIVTCGRVGIFLDCQACRRVLHEDRAQHIVDFGFFQRGLNVFGDVVKALAPSSYRDALCHPSIPVVWLCRFDVPHEAVCVKETAVSLPIPSTTSQEQLRLEFGLILRSRRGIR